MSQKGRKWDEKTKQIAIAKLQVNANTNEVSRETGIPRSTLNSWAKELEKDGESIAKLRQQNKEKFVQNAWRLIGKLQNSIEKDLDNADSGGKVRISARDKAIIMATLYDKQALVSKEPTEIVEGEVKITKFEDL